MAETYTLRGVTYELLERKLVSGEYATKENGKTVYKTYSYNAVTVREIKHESNREIRGR